MPAYHTFTGNLLAERTLELARPWQAGGTHRATAESFQVGGKGFNVAKLLARLGADVTAIGFAGGAAGEECRAWLAAHARYRAALIPTSAPTRTGVVVRAPEQPETTWLAPDRPPDEAAFAAAARHLAGLPADAVVSVCGSVPGWATDAAAPLRAALAERARAGILVIDTYGPPLADLVRTPVALVKINRSEFRGLFPDWPTDPDAEAPRWRRLLVTLPVRAWVVTDGPRPVHFAAREACGAVSPPPVQEVSATGSGDVLLGALLYGWAGCGAPLADVLRWAVNLAASNAAAPEIAEFPLPSCPFGTARLHQDANILSGLRSNT